jgi:phage gp46-like protein
MYLAPLLLEGQGVSFDLSFKNQSPLEEAVMLSLFTDRRYEGRGGWWGDAMPPIEGVLIGSYLHTLFREKQTEQVRLQAQRYCEQALAWLIEEGYIESFSVSVSFPRAEWILIEITLKIDANNQALVKVEQPLGAI